MAKSPISFVLSVCSSLFVSFFMASVACFSAPAMTEKCRESWGMGFSEGGGDPKKGGGWIKKGVSYPSANYVHLTSLFLSLHLALLP